MSEDYLPQQQQQQRQPMNLQEEESVSGLPLAEQSFLKARIDVSEIILTIKHALIGEIKDEKGDWKKVGSPLLNKVGANRLISIINFYVNSNTIFGELLRDDINEICYGLGFDLKQALVINESEWAVKDFMLTKRAIVDFVFITLTRAQNRGEAESIGRLTSIRTVVERPGEKRSSRLPFFGGKD